MGQRNEYHGNKFLDSPCYAALLRALFPQAAFIPKDRSVTIPFNLQSESVISKVEALIDSGATDNFISPHVIELWKIQTRKLHRSVHVPILVNFRTVLLGGKCVTPYSLL
jgi:hypothetical protein